MDARPLSIDMEEHASDQQCSLLRGIETGRFDLRTFPTMVASRYIARVDVGQHA